MAFYINSVFSKHCIKTLPIIITGIFGTLLNFVSWGKSQPWKDSSCHFYDITVY